MARSLLLMAGALVAAAAEEAHGIEYAGAFAAPDRWYSLNLDKVGGAYAAPHMALVLLPMEEEPTVEAMIALAQTAHARLDSGVCAEADAGDTLMPGALTPAVNASHPGCYELHLEDSWATSSFLVDNGAAHTHLVLFTEHLLSEFQASATIGAARDSAGAAPDYELELDEHDLAGEEHVEEPEAARPWGGAIGAALLVCTATFSGVILLAPGVSFIAKKWADSFEAVITAFAAGALLSAAFNMLLYEASHLIASGVESENDAIWRWGACILGGFAASGVIDIFASALAHSVLKRASKNADQGKSKDGAVTPGHTHGKDDGVAVKAAPLAEEDCEHGHAHPHALVASRTARYRVLGGVLLGDFVHNLCDGVFIGAAFLSCGVSFGWSVAGASIAHEVAQEISDFVVLTSPNQGGLSPKLALLLNFLGGLSTLLGVVIVLGSGEVNSSAIGMLLAFGGGVYIHIGATECMPKVYALAATTRIRVLSFLAFVVGAVAIGLVLVGHAHCTIGAAAGDDGHGH